MWEQLQLTYSYGVDKLWILNVGTEADGVSYHSFYEYGWNPERYAAGDLLSIHGCSVRSSSVRNRRMRPCVLNLYCKYNGRVTPEMLDRILITFGFGEWRQVLMNM